MTQKQMILEYLNKGHRINQKKAVMYFGIIRLAAIIWYLRADGYDIKCNKKRNLQNQGWYKEYYIEKDNNIYTGLELDNEGLIIFN